MRLTKLKNKFKTLFGSKPNVIVNSPGRAEIIGNHTDYNQGYALGCAIDQNTLGLFKKRNDQKVIIYSTSTDLSNHVVEFSLSDLHRDENIHWGNYARAVAQELIRLGYQLTGAEILVDTNFPTSGGLSSSAALEICLAYGWLTLLNQPIAPNKIAVACQRGENGQLVQSPCGFLDQGTITFAEKNKMVLFNFSPPVKTKLIDSGLITSDATLLAVVDKSVKRELGDSGFPARRKMCEKACELLKIDNLSKLTLKSFNDKKHQLPKTMRKRVEHVVAENQRVLDAVKALRDGEAISFGKLLNQSGQSALDLFGLDEKTPELRLLMESAQKVDGVLGARNMGGGFSAIILVLIKNEFLTKFKNILQTKYNQKFPGKLVFIPFNPGRGVSVLSS